MSNKHYTIEAFTALLRAGLWEKDARLLTFDASAFQTVYRIAEEQSVIGLVAAGLEHMVEAKAPKTDVLQLVGQALQLEQTNTSMNHFIEVITEKLRKAGIYALLIKGQGVAQCYEKPLWRSCGDIDLFLNSDDYEKAKSFFRALSDSVEKENTYLKHIGFIIQGYVVELHGTLRSRLSKRIDRNLDQIKQRIFFNGEVRAWRNGETEVFLLSPNNDVVFVFTHILHHFFTGGIGLRQICDWIRLLWAYKNEIETEDLEKRLKAMGLMTEWKAFAAMAVDYLGMPAEAMPLYSSEKKWSRKGDKICAFVMEVGNFGHNRDNSYYAKYPFLIRKLYSFGRRCGDLFRHARIFPLDSLEFFPYMMYNGIKAALRGK